MGDMSEGEYQLQMQACEDAGKENLVHPALEVPSGYWRTRDGTVMWVHEMTDAHLDNAIALFGASDWSDHPKVEELRFERARRASRARV